MLEERRNVRQEFASTSNRSIAFVATFTVGTSIRRRRRCTANQNQEPVVVEEERKWRNIGPRLHGIMDMNQSPCPPVLWFLSDLLPLPPRSLSRQNKLLTAHWRLETRRNDQLFDFHSLRIDWLLAELFLPNILPPAGRHSCPISSLKSSIVLFFHKLKTLNVLYSADRSSHAHKQKKLFCHRRFQNIRNT